MDPLSNRIREALIRWIDPYDPILTLTLILIFVGTLTLFLVLGV